MRLLTRVNLVVAASILSVLSGTAIGVNAADRQPATDGPPNNFIGLRGAGAHQVAAVCALGGARASDRSVSVWVGLGGTEFLDIVQVGIIATTSGRHFFAAFGSGSPGEVGSVYVEQDLGAADALPHALAVDDTTGVWRMIIDGRVVMTQSDAFRSWVVRSRQVMHETEGPGDQMGGSSARPVACHDARGDGPGDRMAWSMGGFGAKAAAAQSAFGGDWFAIS